MKTELLKNIWAIIAHLAVAVLAGVFAFNEFSKGTSESNFAGVLWASGAALWLIFAIAFVFLIRVQRGTAIPQTDTK